MGTRSVVNVVDERGDTILRLYGQSDGYPSGMGVDVAKFLANKRIVNGYGLDDPSQQFNGAGDLAVRLVTYLKNTNSTGFNMDKGEFVKEIGHDHIGGYYIQAPVDGPEPEGSWVEYVYTVKVEVDTPEAIIEFSDLNNKTQDTAPASVFADKWADGSHD